MRDGVDHPHRLEPAALPRAGAEGGHAHRATCKAGDPGDCRDRGGVLAGSLARARPVGLEHSIAANTALAVIAPGSVPRRQDFWSLPLMRQRVRLYAIQRRSPLPPPRSSDRLYETAARPTRARNIVTEPLIIPLTAPHP